MTLCLPECNIISALSFVLKASLTKMVRLRKPIDNCIYFKLSGGLVLIIGLGKSLFFCPCKGVVHKINTTESHLCLQ